MVDPRPAHEADDYRSLRVLEQIEENPSVSQREIARSLGSSLGVANACVQTLVRKGLIKIRGESNRSITYHLTKQGLARKAQLAVEWTNNTIGFYVEARRTIRNQLATLRSRGITSVMVYGANEAAELVVVLSADIGITVVSVVRGEGPSISDAIVGIPVVPVADAREAQAAIVCASASETEVAKIREAFPGMALFALDGREL